MFGASLLIRRKKFGKNFTLYTLCATTFMCYTRKMNQKCDFFFCFVFAVDHEVVVLSEEDEEQPTQPSGK